MPLGADGTFCVYTANATELLVDLFGSYAPTSGVKFQPVAAARLYDSRSRTTPLPAGTTLRVKVAGTVSVPKTFGAGTTVCEGGAVVWRAGAFVPGVAGVLTGVDDGPFVTLTVDSGAFEFSTAPGR